MVMHRHRLQLMHQSSYAFDFNSNPTSVMIMATISMLTKAAEVASHHMGVSHQSVLAERLADLTAVEALTDLLLDARALAAVFATLISSVDGPAGP